MPLYGDGQFFQYIEGFGPAVSEVYEHIKQSRLHFDLVELERCTIERRVFRTWSMGFREAPASVMQTLSRSAWEREMPALDVQLAPSEGLQELLEFIGVMLS